MFQKLGTQVVVEGVEQHSPLKEGSILWITETRSPLGLVDEIFGPVKNPYYIVRYNSEDEVPTGISQGTLISFVAEFADHVLNDKNLYKKGYDASNENDEEISEESEFSDDEKEAEYRKMKKMSKRGMNDQKPGNKKNNKKKVRDNISSRDSRPAQQMPSIVGQPSRSHKQGHASAVAQSSNVNSCQPSPALGQALIGGSGMVPSFPNVAQTNNLIPPPYGVFTNTMPSQQPPLPQQPQGAAFVSGFPGGVNPWFPQQQGPQLYQMPPPNALPFPQQYNPSFGPMQNVPLPAGSWPGVMGPTGFNQAYGMNMQSQQNLQPVNAGNPGMIPSGMQPPAIFGGNIPAPQNFNIGPSADHNRRRPHGRGAGRFAGRRGPRPS